MPLGELEVAVLHKGLQGLDAGVLVLDAVDPVSYTHLDLIIEARDRILPRLKLGKEVRVFLLHLLKKLGLPEHSEAISVNDCVLMNNCTNNASPP